MAFVVRHQAHAPQYWESTLSMEVLDDALRLIGTVENGAAFGHPVGVAPDDDILVMHVTPEGSTITRVEVIRGCGESAAPLRPWLRPLHQRIRATPPAGSSFVPAL